ncbi:MAG: tRNA-dihydrouridine synthase [Patescibacteria group bacterium]|nr:tRNA-dihydrouridine synthase [Patescibacteria group bacterium]MDE2172807.1 tRNA-dihydrouridine synthase [Patescibacteria group bacterium]
MTTASRRPRISASKANFWQALKRPFFVIAPMANVTDSVFRKLFAKYGRPDVMWTEFVSADGLVSPGGRRLLKDLVFSEKERPIVAQLFTGHPEAMKKAAALVGRLGFDGLDINMGCPDRAVEKQGGGAAMIKSPRSAIAVLDAARAGVRSARTGQRSLPVSIKTRLGYNSIDLSWIGLLLEQCLPALTIHLRTRKEMSLVPAHWEVMPKIVDMRDRIQAALPVGQRTLIIGNGDVGSLAQARDYCRRYGCDGVMIGRGIFGKPWFFARKSAYRSGLLPAAPEMKPAARLGILLEHARSFEREFCPRGRNGTVMRSKRVKSFDVMKKHFKAYVSGWDGAKELRMRLMACENYAEVERIVAGELATCDV